MRKVFIVAGLLLGGALLTGSPAKADLGCMCVKLGGPSMCTATVIACNFGHGGVCVAPFVYEHSKMHKKHMRHHRNMHKKKKM